MTLKGLKNASFLFHYLKVSKLSSIKYLYEAMVSSR
jgi:hypothetical protein